MGRQSFGGRGGGVGVGVADGWGEDSSVDDDDGIGDGSAVWRKNDTCVIWCRWLKAEKQLNVKVTKLEGWDHVLKMAVSWRTEKMLMTTPGQRQEKAILITRVEKYKLEEEMAALSSSVSMAMLYCLCENGECRMILLRGNGGG